MSKLSGLLLIVVGVGVAAYMMPSGSEEVDQALAQEVFVAKAPSTGAVRTTALHEEIVPPVPKPAVRPSTDAAKAQVKPAGNGPTNPTVVTVAQRANEATTVTRPAQQVGAVIVPGDRVGLTRELQRELRRVGCYDGEINGTWTPASRRAMKAFTDRVNATLPVEQPDYILLTLVQGRQERACGAPCPSGQGMSEDGRCLPNAVIARAARKATTPLQPATAAKSETVERQVAATSGWSTTTTVVAPNLPVVPDGRMALSGPKAETPGLRPMPGEGRSDPAVIVPTPDANAYRQQAEAERVTPRGGHERRSKPAAVDNQARRYVSAPRKKFGPWFFRQQDTWNN